MTGANSPNALSRPCRGPWCARRADPAIQCPRPPGALYGPFLRLGPDGRPARAVLNFAAPPPSLDRVRALHFIRCMGLSCSRLRTAMTLPAVHLPSRAVAMSLR